MLLTKDQYPGVIATAHYPMCGRLAYDEAPDFYTDPQLTNCFVLAQFGRRVNDLMLDLTGCLDALDHD